MSSNSCKLLEEFQNAESQKQSSLKDEYYHFFGNFQIAAEKLELFTLRVRMVYNNFVAEHRGRRPS